MLHKVRCAKGAKVLHKVQVRQGCSGAAPGSRCAKGAQVLHQGPGAPRVLRCCTRSRCAKGAKVLPGPGAPKGAKVLHKVRCIRFAGAHLFVRLLCSVMLLPVTWQRRFDDLGVLGYRTRIFQRQHHYWQHHLFKLGPSGEGKLWQ